MKIVGIAVLVIFCLFVVSEAGKKCKLGCMDTQFKNNITELDKAVKNMAKTISSIGVTGNTWSSLSVTTIETAGWQLVFRASSGNKQNVFSAWTQGAGITSTKPTTMDRSYAAHYRSLQVNSWNTLGVKYVKYSYYDHDKEVAYVIFNGQGSSVTDWFASSRVVSSSYPDLTSSGTYNYFSIEGHRAGALARRFFINNNYGGCPADQGHLVVVDADTTGGCNFDTQPVLPQFLYSQINGADKWDKGLYGRADYLAIFIKTA